MAIVNPEKAAALAQEWIERIREIVEEYDEGRVAKGYPPHSLGNSGS